MIPDATTAHPHRQAEGALPPRVKAFLASYEQGPGAVPAEQSEHLIYLAPSLQRMQVLDQPFTFGTIESFLPQGLYQTVLRDWPAEAAFDPVAKVTGGEPMGYLGSRKERVVENWAAGDSLDAQTWNQLRLALRHPVFVRSLFTRFADTVEDNLADLDLDVLCTSSFKLYANVDAGASEALGAHVDALPKLLTIVIYLDLSGNVTGDSAARWGTALYETLHGEVTPLHFTANADHRVTHQVEFAPNRAFVMPNALQALHGVAGGEEEVRRRTLMCGYWLTKQRRKP